MNDFLPWQNFIPKALAQYKLTREARASLVCARFRQLAPDLIGEEARAAVKPKFFKGGVLYVAVPSSIWAQRVYVHRHELLLKLNLHLDKPYVHDLRTVVE